jgi:hypothetical protein
MFLLEVVDFAQTAAMSAAWIPLSANAGEE